MYLDQPTLCRVQVRYLIILMSVVSMCGVVVGTIKHPDGNCTLFRGILGLYNCIAIFAMVKCQPRMLRVSLWFSAAFAIFVLLLLITMPVFIATQAASGHSVFQRNVMEKEVPTPEKSFYNGLALGYLTEALLATLFFLFVFKYVMINRVYMYVTTSPMFELEK